MSSSSSRWLALLGLLAVAGYQNRDKLGQLLGQASGNRPASGAAVPVVAIDGQPVAGGRPGPLTLRLQALYALKSG